MKKEAERDFMRSEYDFSSGVRGKHHDAYVRGTNVVLLEPDVAEVFKDSAAVNAALRALVQVARTHAKIRGGEAAKRVYAVKANSREPRKGSLMAAIQAAIRNEDGMASFAKISELVCNGPYRGPRSGAPATPKNITDAVWHGVQNGLLRVVSGKKVNIKDPEKVKRAGHRANRATAKGKPSLPPSDSDRRL